MTLKRRPFRFELKSADEKTGEFSGYGSVFGVKDWYGEIVVKGAFAATLEDWEGKGKLPPMLWQHMVDQPIGIYSKMVEDDHGLFVEGRVLVDAGEMERRAFAHLKAGSVSGLSIGFSVPPGGLEFNKDLDALILKQVDLWELSVVTFPANEEAQVEEVRAAISNPRECERILREAGFSRSQAKGLMARGHAAIAQRDADDEEAFADVAESIRSLTKFLKGA